MASAKRLSGSVGNTAALRQVALDAYIKAHQEAIAISGRLEPLPNPRDIDIGGVKIPREIAKHIGRWGIPVPVDPNGFKKPGEVW